MPLQVEFSGNPSLGVGGHCIPVDPYYYLEFQRRLECPPISEAARGINESMPRHLPGSLADPKVNGIESSRVLVLGFSYARDRRHRDTPVREFTRTYMIQDPRS